MYKLKLIRKLVFQIPTELNGLRMKWNTRIHSGGYPLRELKYTTKHPTWNAEGAAISETSRGTPGCRMATDTSRRGGSFSFTCKFSVDIALKNAASCVR